MEIPVRYAYLVLDIGFGVLWVMFYIFSPRTRNIQLLISILAAPLGPMIEYFYFQDYWRPVSFLPEISLGSFRLLLEDFLFAFFFTGTTGMLAHITGKKVNNFQIKISLIPKLIAIGLVSSVLSIPFVYLGLNSIFATSISFVTIAGLAAFIKKGAFRYALRCGVATTLMMFAVYYVCFHVTSNVEELYSSIWMINNHKVMGTRFLNLPVTELVWSFSWGNMMGAVREYVFG